jgi:probable rRNA maturation factor
VVVVDDAEIQQLNRDFRGVDRPTSVLSFPADPVPLPEGEGEEAGYLGDLIVSLPYIQRQAAADEHDWRDELILNVVHGTLHLLGYDHDTAANQARMWTVQAEALDALGVPIAVPHFDFPEDSDEDNVSDAPETGRKLS